MMDDRQQEDQCPTFYSSSSDVQGARDWKSHPKHAVVSQADPLKRYAAVQVHPAVPADQKLQKQPPSLRMLVPL